METTIYELRIYGSKELMGNVLFSDRTKALNSFELACMRCLPGMSVFLAELKDADGEFEYVEHVYNNRKVYQKIIRLFPACKTDLTTSPIIPVP